MAELVCTFDAGKEVHPMLRYRDAQGSVFSQTPNTSRETHTTCISKAAESCPTSPSATSSAKSDNHSDGDSFPTASSLGFTDSASDSDSESDAAVSHLQRLQSLAGTWKQHNKRARIANAAPQQDLGDEPVSDGGQQRRDTFRPPQVPAMQVYLHGIDEAVLEAALTNSALWHRIQLQDSLQVTTLMSFLHLLHC